MTTNLAKQFEARWESSDSPPDVFAFLEQHDDSDVVELLPVLLVDQSRRWKTDKPLKVEDYLKRIPSLADFPNAILDLLASEIENAKSSELQPIGKDVLVRLRKLNSFHPKDQTTRTGQLGNDLVSESNAETRSFIDSAQLDSTLATKKDVTPSDVPSFKDYQLIEEIGRGGMGVVYKARHRKLNRLVALKLIRSGEFADKEQIRRFQSEAESLGRLDHSGIVPVFEVGESQGQHFLSMAFVNGENLNERVKAQGPLPPSDAASLIKLVAEAVQYAHKKGVVHRDIKPHNILIDSESGKPRLTDFGLAKRLETDSELTATGQVMGTPSYMPPEQAMGRQGEIGVASDVYSLGATLYFLLVARPPFQAASSVETIRQVLESEPISPQSLNPNVPKDLATICLKCLSKETKTRYAGAGDLADDLQRWLSGEPILARPVSRIEKAWKWCKRRPALVGTAAAAILVLIVVSTLLIEGRNNAEATRLVEGLLQAETSQVSSIIDGLSGYEPWTKDDLQKAFDDSPKDSNAKLHAALAMRVDDKSVMSFLKERLITVTPMQFEHVRYLLENEKSDLTDYYWQIAKEDETPAVRFQAACALASYDPDNDHWENADFCKFVADHLVGVRPSELLPWTNALRPVKDHLVAPLSTIYGNPDEGEQVRSFATDTLADYLSDDADGLFNLLADSNEKQFVTMFDKLTAHRERAVELGNAEVSKTPAEDANEDDKEAMAMRQANAAVMLLRMDATDQVWPLLKHSTDPRVRSYIIHWLRPRDGDADTIIARYEQETNVTIKRALLLCLGEFKLADSEKQPMIEKLLKVYRSDPDAGLHAAAEWLLRQWKQGEKLAAIDKELQQNEEQIVAAKDDPRQWYVNGQGQTLVILDVDEFMMGSPESEAGRVSIEGLHRRKIGRRIAIATKEVTRKQGREFFNATKGWLQAYNKHLQQYVRSDDSPMVSMTWFEAAHYCNWLSEQEGIPEDHWCYEKNEDDEYGPGMKAKEKFLELNGYRLPTEAEWEYACRAGATSSRYYGVTESLLPRHAWCLANGDSHLHPVARLKPNDYGLFDMQGNANEWCYDAYVNYPADAKEAVIDLPSTESVEDTGRRVVRGGAFLVQPMYVRSAARMNHRPDVSAYGFGFRPARTYHLFP